MSGETCPRCKRNSGYPIGAPAPGKKMTFVCKYCSHRWHKFGGTWYLYFFGFLIGAGLGLFSILSKVLKKTSIQEIFEKVKSLPADLVNLINSILQQ